MQTEKILKELRWIGAHYDFYLTMEEIADYIRGEVTDVEFDAQMGLLGDMTKDGRYSAFNVVFWQNKLDNEERNALNLVMSTAWNTAMGKKSKSSSSRSITKRNNGLLMCYVKMSDGSRKTLYDRDETLLRTRADLVELEERQKMLLGRIKDINPTEVEKLSRNIDVLLDVQQGRETGVKKPTQQRAITGVKETLKPSKVETAAVPTFKEAFDMWLKFLRKEGTCSNQTIDHHVSVYKRFIGTYDYFINKPVDQITTSDAYGVLRSIIDEQVSKAEFNLHRQIVRDVLGYLMSEDEFDYDIKVDFSKLELKLKNQRSKFVVKRKKERAIGKEMRMDIETAIDAHMKKHYLKKSRYFLVKLNFYLGLREAELGALTVNDINLEEGYVSIDKAEIHYRETNKQGEYTGKLVFEISKPKTENANRQIPLIPEAKAIVIELLEYRARRGYRNKELIFDGEPGPMRDRVGKLSHAYKMIAKETGITTKEFRSHLQRKTFASSLLNDKRIDMADVTAYMGHSNISTTLNSYVIPEEKTVERRRKELQGAIG